MDWDLLKKRLEDDEEGWDEEEWDEEEFEDDEEGWDLEDEEW